MLVLGRGLGVLGLYWHDNGLRFGDPGRGLVRHSDTILWPIL